MDPDQAARSTAQVVDTYREAKDYTKATQEADAALKKYPDDRAVHAVRAALFSDQNKPDAAIDELKKMLNGKDGDREVYLQMADVYQKSHDYSKMADSLNSAEKLATEKEDKTNILFLRGAMYERQKKYELAEKEFRRVLDDDPKNASAWNYLGYMLADQGTRLTEAQGYIQKALEIDPDNYAYLDSLGLGLLPARISWTTRKTSFPHSRTSDGEGPHHSRPPGRCAFQEGQAEGKLSRSGNRH